MLQKTVDNATKVRFDTTSRLTAFVARQTTTHKAIVPRPPSPLEVVYAPRPNSVAVTEVGIVEGSPEKEVWSPWGYQLYTVEPVIDLDTALEHQVISGPPVDFRLYRYEGRCSSYGCYRHPRP
ncbi:hypothetical protein EVAR_55988_1 [Eumeta japonica]|uniref:Uncharacterized protein n=1 Tax=Eumeta variegata TaxID=151549 RepID=A0A4C1YAY7_EUMVA|nr:hypothetical protein EVAR_55988_1 [Eumeta japonica]